MFVAVSCSKDAEIIIPDPEPVPPIVFTEVDVDLSTAAAGNFNTRAELDPEDEYAITGTGIAADFRVLAFTSGDNGTLLYTRTVKGFTDDGDGDYSFSVSLDITTGTSLVDLWFIANASDHWTDSTATANVGKSKAVVASVLEYAESEGVTQVGTDGKPIANAKPFPLWGVFNGLSIITDPNQTQASGATKGKLRVGTSGTNYETNIALFRQVAKIDLSLTQTGHTLSSVILYNRNTVGSLVPKVSGSYAKPANNIFAAVSLPDEPQPAANDSLHSVTYPITGTSIINSIYAFEIPVTGSGTVPTGQDRLFYEPCLILGAKYLNGSDVTWYRIPFVDGTGKIAIIRNKRYAVTVTALSGPGWSTPEEALKSATVENITAQVIDWDNIEVEFPD
jgi:hypothetical protein